VELYIHDSIRSHSVMLTDLLNYLFSYLLTPWSRVLLEKMTSSQLVTEIPAFYGTRRFIAAFTGACHLSLFWVTSVQSMSPIPRPEDPF